MNTKRTISITIIIVILAAVVIIGAPALYENHCKSRIYSDIETKLDDNILAANVRIVRYETTVDGNMTSYSISDGASGTIVGRDEDFYYVLTAAHILDPDSSDDGETTYSYYVTPGNAETFIELQRRTNYYIDIDRYVARLDAMDVEYISSENDIAILRFQSDDSYTVVALAEGNPSRGGRVAAIGNGDEGQEIHYGEITSRKMKNFSTADGRSDHVLRTNAYVKEGFSGGAILNEDLEIVGMTVGGGSDVFGRFRYGAIIPVSTIAEELEAWRSAA